ncbi:MAG: tetratricopeptide repeat protein [Bacteroidota bacterium]
MKKIILNFSCWALIALFFVGCDGDKPSTTNTTQESTDNTIGKTGILAIDQLTDLIAENPNDPKLYATRAKAFYENDGYDNAILDMASAMKIDSTNADYHHLLADIYLDYSKSRLALQTMKRCVALHPDRIPSLLKLAEFQQILKQYDASMATIAKVMRAEPNNPEGFFMIGLNHVLMGNKQMASKNLQKCVDIDPEHTDAFVLLGKIFDEDDSPLAAQYFENAVQTDPDNPDVLYNQASYLHNHDKLEKAKTILKKIAQLDKSYANAYQRLGIIYIEQDSIKTANANFNIAVKVDPTFGLAYYYRGYTAEQMGDFQAAVNDYQNILNFDPDYERAKVGLARAKKALANK